MYNKEQETAEIICDGDSWVFGCEIVDPNIASKYPKSTHPGEYDYLPENDSYRIPRIFSSHLSELLNIRVTNLSWPADDNGTILRRIINYISCKYLEKNVPTDNLLVIVGWTSPERNSFWYKDNDKSSRLFRIWPHINHFDFPSQEEFWKIYVRYLWNTEEYIPRYILNVLQFQNFCKVHNIKWLCFNSFYQTPGESPNGWKDLNIKEELYKLKNILGQHEFHCSSDPYVRHIHVNDYMSLWDSIDSVRFYKKNDAENTFKSFCIRNSVKEPFNGFHPSELSHKLWAIELYNYIRQNELL